MARKRKRGRKKKEYQNWLDLPNDLTVSILQRLGAIDILESAQKVCMQWRNICKDPSFHVAYNIDMQNLGELHSMSYDLEIMCKHAIDRSCEISTTTTYFASDQLLLYITQSTSQLRRLCLVCCYYITDKKLGELAAKLPLFEELDMTISSLSEEPLKALKAFGRYFPLLKSYKWNQLWDKQLRIRIEGDEEFDDEDEALAIAKNMPELRHLRLNGNRVTNHK